MNLMQYWPVGAAVVAGSVAWGSQQMQIQNLEQAMQAQTTIQAQQAEMKAQAARVDERTRAILEAQERQEQMLQMLLQRVQQ